MYPTCGGPAGHSRRCNFVTAAFLISSPRLALYHSEIEAMIFPTSWPTGPSWKGSATETSRIPRCFRKGHLGMMPDRFLDRALQGMARRFRKSVGTST